MPCIHRTTILSSLLLAACGGGDHIETTQPVDVGGDYTFAVTNGKDTCGFQDWTEGDTTQGMTMTITQSGKEIVGELTDLGTALVIWSLTGSTDFRGQVDKDDVTMKIEGSKKITNEQNDPDCSFWVDAQFEGTLEGDTLNGNIAYVVRIVPGSTCATLDSGCRATQKVAGVRPPK